MSTRILVALGLLLTACGPKQDTRAARPAASARAAAQELTDGNVAAIVTAINTLEIETSRLATERAEDPRVREFARDMIKQHTWVQMRLRQMLADKELELQYDALSAQLNQNLEPTLADLRHARADQFDMDYVVQQIAAHQFAVNSFETTLLDATDDNELRDFLASEVRPAVERHLERVKQLHEDLVREQRREPQARTEERT